MSNIKKIVSGYFLHRYPDQVRGEFADWFSNPIDQAEKDQTLEGMWNNLEVEYNKRAVSRSYERVWERIRKGDVRQRRALIFNSVMRVAAIVVVVIALLGFIKIISMDNNVKWNEVFVPMGENKMVTLADGSTIRLTAGSRLIYPDKFSEDVRKVYLSGEAFADITKDEDHRKFVIAAELVDVIVHGTRFNIRSYESNSEVEVMLFKGSVDMQTKSLAQNRVVRLHPGDFVKLDKRSGRVSCENIPKDMFDEDPHSRRLTFINSRLGDIAVQLERLFDVRIVIDHAELADERYYSAFVNNESLDKILSTLERSGKMKYYWKNGEIHLYY